jgi:hypothetical protein
MGFIASAVRCLSLLQGPCLLLRSLPDPVRDVVMEVAFHTAGVVTGACFSSRTAEAPVSPSWVVKRFIDGGLFDGLLRLWLDLYRANIRGYDGPIPLPIFRLQASFSFLMSVYPACRQRAVDAGLAETVAECVWAFSNRLADHADNCSAEELEQLVHSIASEHMPADFLGGAALALLGLPPFAIVRDSPRTGVGDALVGLSAFFEGPDKPLACDVLQRWASCNYVGAMLQLLQYIAPTLAQIAKEDSFLPGRSPNMLPAPLRLRVAWQAYSNNAFELLAAYLVPAAPLTGVLATVPLTMGDPPADDERWAAPCLVALRAVVEYAVDDINGDIGSDSATGGSGISSGTSSGSGAVTRPAPLATQADPARFLPARSVLKACLWCLSLLRAYSRLSATGQFHHVREIVHEAACLLEACLRLEGVLRLQPSKHRHWLREFSHRRLAEAGMLPVLLAAANDHAADRNRQPLIALLSLLLPIYHGRGQTAPPYDRFQAALCVSFHHLGGFTVLRRVVEGQMQVPTVVSCIMPAQNCIPSIRNLISIAVCSGSACCAGAATAVA